MSFTWYNYSMIFKENQVDLISELFPKEYTLETIADSLYILKDGEIYLKLSGNEEDIQHVLDLLNGDTSNTTRIKVKPLFTDGKESPVDHILYFVNKFQDRSQKTNNVTFIDIDGISIKCSTLMDDTTYDEFLFNLRETLKLKYHNYKILKNKFNNGNIELYLKKDNNNDNQ